MRKERSVGRQLCAAALAAAAASLTLLGFLPGGYPSSYAKGVSNYGSVVVGHGADFGNRIEAFRYSGGVRCCTDGRGLL